MLIAPSAGGTVQLQHTMPNTDWELVGQAADVPSRPQQSAMGALLTLYYPALRAYVMSKWRVTPEEAEEYVQEFLTAKVVGENLIGQARRERGRFRNFLRTTLDAFLVGQFRRAAAKKRSPTGWCDFEVAVVVSSGPDPREAYEVAWAREAIAAAVAGMEHECKVTRRQDLWALFRERILLPTIDGSKPVPYSELVERFNFRSPLQAANALTTAKRMFERNLRAVLRIYSDTEPDIDQEILELKTALTGGHRAGRNWK